MNEVGSPALLVEPHVSPSGSLPGPGRSVLDCVGGQTGRPTDSRK